MPLRLSHALPSVALVAAVLCTGLAQATDSPEVTPGDGVTVEVPSGQSVTLHEVVWNAPGTDGLATRFLFVAPAIAPGGGIDFDTASADMLHLCDAFALPRVKDNTPSPEQIVISLSDRPVPFGQSAPEATQFFESYSIADGVCTWEMF
jgi:hypothetical protein